MANDIVPVENEIMLNREQRARLSGAISVLEAEIEESDDLMPLTVVRQSLVEANNAPEAVDEAIRLKLYETPENPYEAYSTAETSVAHRLESWLTRALDLVPSGFRHSQQIASIYTKKKVGDSSSFYLTTANCDTTVHINAERNRFYSYLQITADYDIGEKKHPLLFDCVAAEGWINAPMGIGGLNPMFYPLPIGKHKIYVAHPKLPEHKIYSIDEFAKRAVENQYHREVLAHLLSIEPLLDNEVARRADNTLSLLEV